MRRGVSWLAAPLLFLLPGMASGQSDAEDLTPITLIRVHKAARTMDLVDSAGRVEQIAGLQLGSQPIGPKRFEGDGRTPEGRYQIDWSNPASAYHLSLHISYPDNVDRARAAAQGRSAGGMIMIHGQPNDWPGGKAGARVPGDWTDGCIALSDPQMEMLWQRVPDGTPIEILP